LNFIFNFFRGNNKKLPIHEKLYHAKLEILKPYSLAPSSGLKFQNLAKCAIFKIFVKNFCLIAVPGLVAKIMKGKEEQPLAR